MSTPHENVPGNPGEKTEPVEDSDAQRLERARWRSRRGLLELELLLKPFVDGGFAGLPENLKQDYERLLDYDDMDAHEWLLARSGPPADLRALISEMREFLKLS